MRRKMASLRLTSLILAVFFLLHALRNSLAHAYQAKAAYSSGIATQKRNLVLTQKEPAVDSTNELGKAKKKTQIGGRKLIISDEDRKEIDDQWKMKKNRAPMLSSSSSSGATKVYETSDQFEVKRVKCEVNVDDQTASDDRSSLKSTEAFSATDYRGFSMRKTLEKPSKRSVGGSVNQMEKKKKKKKKLEKPRNSTRDSAKLNKAVNDEEDEAKRIFEAEKEIMKLMRKDYNGRWKPRRKPPINNHIPNN